MVFPSPVQFLRLVDQCQGIFRMFCWRNSLLRLYYVRFLFLHQYVYAGLSHHLLSLQAESVSESASTPAAPSSRPLSPRQRRAQNQPQRRPTYPVFPAADQQDGSHTGSAVLIVLLTLALAALVFRRIYLAQDYKFDYELWQQSSKINSHQNETAANLHHLPAATIVHTKGGRQHILYLFRKESHLYYI